MIEKVIMGACVVIAGAVIGTRKAKKYENREHVLQDAISMFKSLKNEIKYNMSTLPNAIESSRQNLKSEIKDVLGAISTSIIDNSYSDILLIQEIDRLAVLNSYDRQVISNGILVLGKSDVETQINLMENTINILDIQIKEASEERKRNYKLYRTVGVVAGMMMAVIVI